MPLQYPQTSPYNPYTEPKAPTNWPVIILITFGVIALILAVIFVIIPYFNEGTGPLLKLEDTNCTSDVYNCGDFTTQSEAQIVFDYCFPTAGDVHGLDADGNEEACESLT